MTTDAACALAEASPGAVDVSEIELARTIIAQEQHRLSVAPEGPVDAAEPPTHGSQPANLSRQAAQTQADMDVAR